MDDHLVWNIDFMQDTSMPVFGDSLGTVSPTAEGDKNMKTSISLNFLRIF